MRYTAPDPSDDWELCEIVRRGKRPCSDVYLGANVRELVNVLGQLQLLRAAGCPANPQRGMPTYQKVGKHHLEQSHRTVTVHVLKAKPSGWRLYYFVDDAPRKRIVFLHAVHKKTDQRDPKDFKRCQRLLDAYDAGGYCAEPLELPAG